MKDIQALIPIVGSGEAASAEEITQKSVRREEPAYERYESVEIQAQDRPDRLKKPSTESTDRLGREPSRLVPIGYTGSVQRTG